MVVKNNLRVLMAVNRIDMQTLHEKTGLSRTTISKLYNETSAKIGFDTITTLCAFFKCDIADLFYLEESDND